ncbi:MAG TPA: response regulator transcription factor [Candidatus Limnocylindria bacterium]|nr:response regulator transcription factor [Candidatus Limnocylindria bacterium]
MAGRGGLTILVVDDDPAMVGALGALLGQAGHRIVAAYDGDEALRRFHADRVDVVLLDLAMPGLDGADVCRQIRAEADTPIIVVSGERDRAATAQLLDLGADDYVRKPFRADELLARVRAVTRRRTTTTPGTSASGASGWQLDHRRHEIRWQGALVPATAIEFRLLAALVGRLGELVTHAELLEAGWPDVPDPDPLWLKPHLARLRDKLDAVGAPRPVAMRGVGYRLEN